MVVFCLFGAKTGPYNSVEVEGAIKSVAPLIVVEGLMSRTVSRQPAITNLILHRFEHSLPSADMLPTIP